MKKVYQFIRILKPQILSRISNNVSVTMPGFPIFLALIMLLIIAFLFAPEYKTTMPGILYESTNDSFRLRVPQGWEIFDLPNTGSTQESAQGYEILAHLCPEEKGGQQQEEHSIVSNSSMIFSGSCQQQSQEEITHIIRYPNLGARLGIALNNINDVIPDSVLEYQIQKLQEVGYRDIKIVNSVDTALLVYYPGTTGLQATVPARSVEMTYSTNSTSSSPIEMRRGYLILTATNVIPPNLETITGYSIFYEGASEAAVSTAEETGQSGSSPPPLALIQIVSSFQLIASQEAQDLIAALARQQISSNQTDDAGEEPSQLTSGKNRYLDTTTVMIIIVYSLLVIGLVWKFIRYMWESRNSTLDEIS
jgi:hypothetical protein